MSTARRIVAVIFLFFLFVAPLASGSATDSEAAAQAAVGATVQELLVILQDKTLSNEQRIGSIEELVLRRFDLPTFSRIVIGRKWSAFSDQQKDQFICEFKPYISGYVGKSFDRYQPESLAILRARDETRGDVVVTTRIVGGRFDRALLDYRLRKTEHDWLVIDLSFEGVRWAANLRAQFSEFLNRGGPEDALAALRSKNPPSTLCEGRSNGAISSTGVLALPVHAMAGTKGLQ